MIIIEYKEIYLLWILAYIYIIDLSVLTVELAWVPLTAYPISKMKHRKQCGNSSAAIGLL